ncbi:MAG: hypothetical protein ACI8R4_000296 [Paracoccaceae bacterium]|jgi:hypothetical protein
MQARLRLKLNRPLRFSGVFPTREQAPSSLPGHRRAAYDNDDVAEVNFAAMTQRMAWDYPVIYWISTLLQKSPQSHLSVLDAGGHMGTKYIAFFDLIPVQDLTWSGYDLPAILRAARSLQASGTVPEKIRFIDDPGTAGQVDMLLASGLLQYLDVSLAELLGQMAAPPRYVLRWFPIISAPNQPLNPHCPIGAIVSGINGRFRTSATVFPPIPGCLQAKAQVTCLSGLTKTRVSPRDGLDRNNANNQHTMFSGAGQPAVCGISLADTKLKQYPVLGSCQGK